jgi:hypothetical protein|tara:strand:- start:78 stop:413 length:336 start_codon:yes stop_codon:yes gene_type:complete
VVVAVDQKVQEVPLQDQVLTVDLVVEDQDNLIQELVDQETHLQEQVSWLSLKEIQVEIIIQVAQVMELVAVVEQLLQDQTELQQQVVTEGQEHLIILQILQQHMQVVVEVE